MQNKDKQNTLGFGHIESILLLSFSFQTSSPAVLLKEKSCVISNKKYMGRQGYLGNKSL